MGSVLRHPNAPQHPTAVVLRPPVNVSAFIRFCRYAALGTGVVWGYWRYRQLCKQHVYIREYEYQQMKLEHEKDARVKKFLAFDDMKQVAEQMSLDWTPELQAQLGVKDPYGAETQPAKH